MKFEEIKTKTVDIATQTALWAMTAGIFAGLDYIHRAPEQTRDRTASDIIALVKKGEVKAQMALQGSQTPINLSLTPEGDRQLNELQSIAERSKTPITFTLLADGKAAFCNFTIEAELLSTIARAIRYNKDLGEPPSFSTLASHCGMKADELRGKIKVNVNEQEFAKFTAPATPHTIVSGGKTVSTVIPQQPTTQLPGRP